MYPHEVDSVPSQINSRVGVPVPLTRECPKGERLEGDVFLGKRCLLLQTGVPHCRGLTVVLAVQGILASGTEEGEDRHWSPSLSLC